MSRRGRCLSFRDDTAAAGWPRPSLAEGRGLPLITVCGLRPRDARFISFTRVLVVGQRLFSVGSGGARFRAPLDLPVIIPRVKKRPSRRRLRALRVRPMGESSLRTASGSAVHFGTRAALCERQPLQMPINAVAPPLACPSGRLRRGDMRGAGAFVPSADLQRPIPLSGRVTAAKQHPSGRLRRCPAGSAYAERKARRLAQTSSDRFAARLRLGAYPYGLAAVLLGYPRLSARRISPRAAERLGRDRLSGRRRHPLHALQVTCGRQRRGQDIFLNSRIDMENLLRKRFFR